MINQYSLRYEGDLVKGAKRFVKMYEDNFKQTELSYDERSLYIGEIKNVAVIVSESSSVPNLTMIGLKELVKEAEKEIISNKFKLYKLK